jgi:hypothetical protein
MTIAQLIVMCEDLIQNAPDAKTELLLRDILDNLRLLASIQ